MAHDLNLGKYKENCSYFWLQISYRFELKLQLFFISINLNMLWDGSFEVLTAYAGDKKYFNIALVLQDERLTIFTSPANTCTCPLKAYTIKYIRELYVI